MFYDGYHLWGMHLAWWLVWLIFIFWIFATPYDIPDQQKRKDPPLDILQKRFAAGKINKEEYEEKKKLLEGGKIPMRNSAFNIITHRMNSGE